MRFFRRRAARHDANDGAGLNGGDAFDYSVSAFADLFAKALHDAPSFAEMPRRGTFVRRFEHDPIWLRLPPPGM